MTKVLTSLLLADMVARGEVAFDDPVSKYLPSSLTLHERGRPIRLLDLATYRSGLPNMPGNLPPDWYAYPIRWAITPRPSYSSSSRVMCRNMSRVRIMNTPISASVCSALRLGTRGEELRGTPYRACLRSAWPGRHAHNAEGRDATAPGARPRPR